MSEDCKILELEGVTLNGSKTAYGGALQSFSMSLNGISSQVKATATLVGASDSPSSGDAITVTIMGGKKMKMQVGGYDVKSSASAADTMTLQLYDTSNIFLDNNHIVLKEEIPEEGGVPSNVFVLGLKYGPLPSADLAENGIITADSDTQWGDLRHFYELETPSCDDEKADDKKGRINQNIKGAPGKTLWPATGSALDSTTHTLESALGNILNGNSELVAGDFDFKGTFRDVIVQYCNALGLQAWWDLEKEEVVIKQANSIEDGFALLEEIRSECEIVSSGQNVDYTPTLAKGAIGSITSSFQGENQASAGREQSKFVLASLLAPVFKYCKCANKVKAQAGADRLTELKFNNDVLKAIQAAAHDKLFAAYALQSAFIAVDPIKGQKAVEAAAALQKQIRDDLIAKAAALCGSVTMTAKAGNPPATVNPERALGVEEWGKLLPKDDPPFQTKDADGKPGGNAFLNSYYAADDDLDRWCSAQLSPVKIGSLLSEGKDKIAFPQCHQMLQVAQISVKPPGPQDPGAAKIGDVKKGWNNNLADDPFKTLDVFGQVNAQFPLKAKEGGFVGGKIVLQKTGHFDSILGSGGLEGANDVLAMYLRAIAKFRNRFYVIKEDRGECVAQSVNVAGRTYGYYVSSEAQNSPVSFEAEDGYKLVQINPFVPLGECSCGELVAMAQTLAMMYLPNTKVLASVMGMRPDFDNPQKIADGTEDGFPGAAVIDFIYALESDAEKPLPGEVTGLELFFNGDGKKAKPVRRAIIDDEDSPQLTMHLLVVDGPENELKDIPQIGFMSNPNQRDKFNLGAFEGAEAIAGPAANVAEELVINLASALSSGSKPLGVIAKGVGEGDPEIAIWGIKSTEFNNLHGNITGGVWPDLEGKPFIPAASLTEAGPDEVKVWYRVGGVENSFNSQPGEFSLTGMISPATNCWTAKFDFGISVNAADIGRNNATSGWGATSATMGNSYSFGNRSLMLGQLYGKLRQAAASDNTVAVSKTLTYVSTKRFEEEEFDMPTMAEGLESLSVSINGNRTEVSLTVGNSIQRQASKAMFERMVQSPGTLYRPGGVMPNSFQQGVSPRFQNFMKGR